MTNLRMFVDIEIGMNGVDQFQRQGLTQLLSLALFWIRGSGRMAGDKK